MCAGSGVMCRVKRGTLRSGDGVIEGRIIVKNGLTIENLGNFRLKILGILYLCTVVFELTWTGGTGTVSDRI